jgi:hypothetical protein
MYDHKGAMCDAGSVAAFTHVFLVHVIWSEVAGDPGESVHIRLTNRFGQGYESAYVDWELFCHETVSAGLYKPRPLLRTSRVVDVNSHRF